MYDPPANEQFLPQRMGAGGRGRGGIIAMTVVMHQLVGDEADRVLECSYIANPDVVHRDIGRERQGCLQYIPSEGHTAAQVTVLHQQIIETA